MIDDDQRNMLKIQSRYTQRDWKRSHAYLQNYPLII